MPIGVQFENLNRYRRYPFMDDADISCVVHSDSNNYAGDFPVDFLRAFRFVHVGVAAIRQVNLVSASIDRDQGNQYNLSFGFKLFSVNPGRVKFFCKGEPLFLDDDILSFSVPISISEPHPFVRVFSVSDFDFSNCISVCVKVDPFAILDGARKIVSNPVDRFSIDCNIPILPALVVSLDSPHVMSVMDDVGEPIRDKNEIGVIAGYNVKFDVMPGTNALLVSAVSGTGAGEAYCESGITTLFSGAAVKKINGVSASQTGGVQLAGGAGISVQPISGTNIINIYSTSEDKDSMECKMS